jgi:hypothetical protein
VQGIKNQIGRDARVSSSQFLLTQIGILNSMVFAKRITNRGFARMLAGLSVPIRANQRLINAFFDRRSWLCLPEI